MVVQFFFSFEWIAKSRKGSFWYVHDVASVDVAVCIDIDFIPLCLI